MSDETPQYCECTTCTQVVEEGGEWTCIDCGRQLPPGEDEVGNNPTPGT